jgi:hypothetical protein
MTAATAPTLGKLREGWGHPQRLKIKDRGKGKGRAHSIAMYAAFSSKRNGYWTSVTLPLTKVTFRSL